MNEKERLQQCYFNAAVTALLVVMVGAGLVVLWVEKGNIF